jgi:hypothetical protein
VKRIHFISTFFFFLISTFFNSNAALNFEHTKGWKAGVSRMVITPDKPMWLAGYASRNSPSEGKLHDLWAKALVLEDANGKQAVLITTDILGMTKELTDKIRIRLKEKWNLDADQIMINSSHTHTGPVIQNALFDIYPLNTTEKKKIEKYTNWLENQIVNVVNEAFRSLEPVHIYSGNGVSRFQVNRRNNNASELLQQTELKGPNDYAVPVIKVENESGKLIAIAFGYACHPTVLSINLWSGDYPGFAQIELEKYHPGATAMFFQGAGADQNPLPRHSIALAQQYGRDLAAAVDRVLNEEMRELTPQLLSSYSEIELPLAKAPTKKELLEYANSNVDYIKRWATRMLHELEMGKPFQTSYPYPLQIWEIGNQKIFAMGGEVVIEYSIKLKQIFGQDIFVLGYTNDVMAYIPSITILNEGGYEGKTSQMVYGLPSTWSSDIEPLILEKITNLAKKTGIIPIENHLSDNNKTLIAKRYFSGFDKAHDTYNAISCASDGNIYYVLSSQAYDKGGQMYVYKPDSDKTEFVADLTDICGEKEAKAIAQGKSHVNFQEKDGKLYFATHVGFYEIIDGAECLPVNAPDGYKLYPGGHFLSYDLTTKKFEDLAIAPEGEGIITMTLDAERGQIYGITWPKGFFIHYDINTHKLKNLGLVSANGEAGTPGDDYRVLCRSMFVDQDGSVYYSTSEGDIFTYNSDLSSPEKVEDVNLRLDYFGKYDPSDPGSMGYNWRRIVWYPEEQAAYGVHGNSGYLFRFDPQKRKIEIVDRITSEPSKKSGMFDQFSYGYLGFMLGPDNHTLYYLTGGPIYIDGKRVKGVDEIAMGAAKGLENLHLITYNIPQNNYSDHGPVFYSDGTRPTYVNSIAVDPKGNVYSLARFNHNGEIIEDLIKIPNPFIRH